jgi:hypothetical protein
MISLLVTHGHTLQVYRFLAHSANRELTCGGQADARLNWPIEREGICTLGVSREHRYTNKSEGRGQMNFRRCLKFCNVFFVHDPLDRHWMNISSLIPPRIGPQICHLQNTCWVNCWYKLA